MDLSVASAQLSHLLDEKRPIRLEIGVIPWFRTGKLVAAPLVRIVGVMPVNDRVVKAQGEASTVTGISQHPQDIQPYGLFITL